MKVNGKEVLEDLRKHVKIEIDLDGFVISQVDKLAIPMVDSLLEKLMKVIPGQLDDALISSFKPMLYKEVKEELVSLLSKVEDKIDNVVKGE